MNKLYPLILFLTVLCFRCNTPKSDKADQPPSDTEFSEEENGNTEQDEKAQRPSPPATASGLFGDLTINLDYSSPAVKDREIWGALVPYGKVWRTGANEANVITLNTDVSVNGEKLPAGKYSLFTIPGEGDWTVIFNKIYDQWGAFDYDPSEDILRIKVTPERIEELQERLFFDIDDAGRVVFKWEYLTFRFEVKRDNRSI